MTPEQKQKIANQLSEEEPWLCHGVKSLLEARKLTELQALDLITEINIALQGEKTLEEYALKSRSLAWRIPASVRFRARHIWLETDDVDQASEYLRSCVRNTVKALAFAVENLGTCIFLCPSFYRAEALHVIHAGVAKTAQEMLELRLRRQQVFTPNLDRWIETYHPEDVSLDENLWNAARRRHRKTWAEKFIKDLEF